MKVKISNPFFPLSIFVVGLILRASLILRTTVNPDDINFFNISLHSRFSQIIFLKYWAVDYPQGFFILNRLWILHSTDLIFLKIVNLIFYAISSVLLYKLGKKFFKDPLATLFPLALMSFSIFIIQIDITLTPYSASFTLSLALLYILINLSENFSLKKLTALGSLSLLSTFISYQMFFMIFSLLTYLAISFLKNPNKKRHLEIGIVLLFSTIPSLLQISQHLSSFTSLSPSPSTLLISWNFYSKIHLAPILSIPFASLVVLVFPLFLFKFEKQSDNVRRYLLPFSIIASSVMSLAVIDKLGLFIASRLFLTFELGLILLISILGSKNRFLKLIITYFILVLLITDSHYVLGKINKTNKQTFESISKQMYSKCTPHTIFMIDSSYFYFFPLYYYYIPFSQYRTHKQYDCIHEMTNTVDKESGDGITVFSDSKEFSYYFINMNQKSNTVDSLKYVCPSTTLVNNFTDICKNFACYIYNVSKGKFERVDKNSDLWRLYNKNLVRNEFTWESAYSNR